MVQLIVRCSPIECTEEIQRLGDAARSRSCNGNFCSPNLTPELQVFELGVRRRFGVRCIHIPDTFPIHYSMESRKRSYGSSFPTIPIPLNPHFPMVFLWFCSKNGAHQAATKSFGFNLAIAIKVVLKSAAAPLSLALRRCAKVAGNQNSAQARGGWLTC